MEPRRETAPGVFGCCGLPTCFKEHIVAQQLGSISACCSESAVAQDCYSYYLKAIALKEQERMLVLGRRVDRRTFKHLRADLAERSVRSLVCMCCGQMHASSNGARAAIGNMLCNSYFAKLSKESFRANMCIEEYMKPYGRRGAMVGHPDLQENAWNWRRRLSCPSIPWAGYSV